MTGFTRQQAWVVALVIYLVGLGAAMQYAKFVVTFDLILERFDQPDSLAGLLLSSVGFVGILLGVMAAILARRIGLVRVFLLGIAIGCLCSLLQTLGLGFWGMMGTRLFEGMSHLAIVVAAPTLIAAIVDERDRSTVLLIWGTFFGVAFAMMGWAGRMIAISYSVEFLFLLHAIWLLIAGIALAWLLRGYRDDVTPMDRSIIAEHKRIYTNLSTLTPSLAWIFYTFSFVSLFALIPNQANPEWRGFLLTVMPLATIASSLIFGVMLQRMLPASSVVRIGLLLASALLLMLALFGGNILLPVLFAGAMGLVQGASFSSVPEFNNNQTDIAAANAGMAQAGNFGNNIGTPILIWVSASFGTNVMIGLVSALLALGFALHLMSHRRLTAQGALAK